MGNTLDHNEMHIPFSCLSEKPNKHVLSCARPLHKVQKVRLNMEHGHIALPHGNLSAQTTPYRLNHANPSAHNLRMCQCENWTYVRTAFGHCHLALYTPFNILCCRIGIGWALKPLPLHSVLLHWAVHHTHMATLIGR